MKIPTCSRLGLTLALLAASSVAQAQVGAAEPAATQPSATTAVPGSTPAAAGPVTPAGDPVGTTPNPASTVPSATEGTQLPGTEPPKSDANADANASDKSDSNKKKKKKRKGQKNDKANDKANDNGSDKSNEQSGASDNEDSDGKDSDGKDSDGKDSDGKDADGKDGKKLPWEAKPKIHLGGLLHSQFAINDAPDSSDYDFRLANARIFLVWQQGSLLDAQAEVELSRDGDRNATSWAPMRDAFVRVSFDAAIRARLGQFKKPFGKLALTNLRDLKLIRRGISDVWVNEELEYGERDVGFMLDGKLGKGIEIHYALGVFNGNGRNRRDSDPNGAKDIVGRLEGRLGKHLSIGVNSANKRFDPNADREWVPPKSAWMTGADVLFEMGGLYALFEGQYGSNYRSANQYHTGSLLALVAYKIPVTAWWEIAVEPLVKGEILKVETEVRDRHILNGTAGANLHVGDIFRLMVQGEWIEPKGTLPANLAEARPEKRLIVQAGMYTR